MPHFFPNATAAKEGHQEGKRKRFNWHGRAFDVLSVERFRRSAGGWIRE
jgi:hypothetical protein